MPSLVMIDDGGNDPFTKILMHFDGANGGTSFPDSALGATTSHTWSGHASAFTGTAFVKFGTASFTVGVGGGSFVDTPNSVDFTLGASNWTVDFWVNRNTWNGARSLFGQSLNGGAANTTIAANFTASNDINFYVSDGATINTFSSGVAITDSNWHHLAFVRSSNALFHYVDGVVATAINGVAFSGTVPDSGNKFAIGRLGESTAVADFAGNIDEFRLSVGIARWTANFVPPTSAYGPN